MTEFKELDCVRVKRAIRDEDCNTDKPVFVKAGQGGTVVLASPGVSTYQVEFVLGKSEKDFYCAVLDIPADNLELEESFADYLERKKSMLSPADAASGAPTETENAAARKGE